MFPLLNELLKDANKDLLISAVFGSQPSYESVVACLDVGCK